MHVCMVYYVTARNGHGRGLFVLERSCNKGCAEFLVMAGVAIDGLCCGGCDCGRAIPSRFLVQW